MQLRINTNRPEVQRAFERWPAEMRAALVRGLRRGAEIVEKDAKLRLTQNKSVAFGLLRASIGSVVDEAKLTAAVGPGLNAKATGAATGDPANYGYYVEFGRAPGKPPPPQALSLWVKRKLGVGGDDEIERVSVFIARKIAREGTIAKPFLGPAGTENAGAILARIDKELDVTIQRLNAQP